MKIKNLRDSEEFNVLADLIREINPSGDQLIFSPSAGNWGDGLINYGTRQFLNAHHFSWKEINKKDNAKAFTESSFKDRIVLMGGEGGVGPITETEQKRLLLRCLRVPSL